MLELLWNTCKAYPGYLLGYVCVTERMEKDKFYINPLKTRLMLQIEFMYRCMVLAVCEYVAFHKWLLPFLQNTMGFTPGLSRTLAMCAVAFAGILSCELLYLFFTWRHADIGSERKDTDYFLILCMQLFIYVMAGAKVFFDFRFAGIGVYSAVFAVIFWSLKQGRKWKDGYLLGPCQIAELEKGKYVSVYYKHSMLDLEEFPGVVRERAGAGILRPDSREVGYLAERIDVTQVSMYVGENGHLILKGKGKTLRELKDIGKIVAGERKYMP